MSVVKMNSITRVIQRWTKGGGQESSNKEKTALTKKGYIMISVMYLKKIKLVYVYVLFLVFYQVYFVLNSFMISYLESYFLKPNQFVVMNS